MANLRDITTETDTALRSPVVRPVLIGRLDITTDPVVAWTGPGIFTPSGTGDSALDGQVFEPVGAFVDMDNVKENQDMGGPLTISAPAHDLDEQLMRQVVRDKRKWRGQKAWVWLGLLDEDDATVIQNPVRIKTGVMTQMKIVRKKEAEVVKVTIDVDLGNATSAPFRLEHHATRLHPSDTFSTFMVKLANKPSGLGSLTGIQGRRSAESNRRGRTRGTFTGERFDR